MKRILRDMYLRHCDAWNDKAEGGFVAFMEPMVSKFAILGPKNVVTGNVTIEGYVEINDSRTLNGGDIGLVIRGRTLTQKEIDEISILRR